MLFGHNARSGKPVGFTLAAFVAIGVAIAQPVDAGTLEPGPSEPFGTFNNVDYVRHTGRFTGETAQGGFDVPYEIVVPADPTLGNGTVLFEPPHFAFGPLGRDLILGRDFLFNSGFSYAAVGWSDDGLSVLDPTATPIIIADEEVEEPGVPQGDAIVDVEILAQFVNALKADLGAIAIAGNFDAIYSFGASQSSAAQLQILLGPEGQRLFDFSLVTLRYWPEPFAELFDRLDGEFEPPSGIGRTIFVYTESELIVSDAEQFRIAAENPNYRVYEIAGGPHFPQPPPFNPLDWTPVMRAAFMAGDAWVRWGVAAPPSALIRETSGIDPIYGLETGIERDFNGNALGGIRLPDVELGRALFIATIPGFDPFDIDTWLFGLWMDLKCEPLPDGLARFPNHGQYVEAVEAQAEMLAAQRYLLPEEVGRLVSLAAGSNVGRRGSCPLP